MYLFPLIRIQDLFSKVFGDYFQDDGSVHLATRSCSSYRDGVHRFLTPRLYILEPHSFKYVPTQRLRSFAIDEKLLSLLD